MEYTTFTLANGLRVVHNCEPTRAMVAINLLYDVGSRDESPELTGIAHLFEHLMFGGSANIADYTRAIEAALSLIHISEPTRPHKLSYGDV